MIMRTLENLYYSIRQWVKSKQKKVYGKVATALSSGYLGKQDTFYLGTIWGVEKIH